MGFFSFGKKQQEPTNASASVEATVSGAFVAQPEKARKFFDHAKQMASVGNHEYALMLYARGVKLDPSAMAQHEAFYRVGIAFYQAGGKPAPREQIKGFQIVRQVDTGKIMSQRRACRCCCRQHCGNAGQNADV